MANPILEVIACSVSDAIEAQKGGASRLEIVKDLSLGGLTPSFEVAATIQEAVDLPIRVMLRESVGYEISCDEEVEALCVAAERFAKLGVDGVVIGFLKVDRVDVELTKRVLARAPSLKATFHHAFEEAGDQFQALRDIKRLSQVDRILSSGGTGELTERIIRLGNYQKSAAPEITIIAGGSIDGDAISSIRKGTSIREFHVGRAARAGFDVNGNVQAELVSRLVRIMQR